MQDHAAIASAQALTLRSSDAARPRRGQEIDQALWIALCNSYGAGARPKVVAVVHEVNHFRASEVKESVGSRDSAAGSAALLRALVACLWSLFSCLGAMFAVSHPSHVLNKSRAGAGA